MFVENVSILNKHTICRTKTANANKCRFGSDVTSFDYYDGSAIIKSPKLTSMQKEFLIFPDEVIEWSNKNKLTPEGTYVIYLPKSYYDSKREKYVDTYKLVNEYQKNIFKQRASKYPKEAYYSRNIPENCKMKRLSGFVSIVSPENEQLIKQKNSNSIIVSTAFSAAIAAAAGWGIYKLTKFISTLK